MTVTTYDPTGLIAGDYPVTTRNVLVSGDRKRGDVLGKVDDGTDPGAHILSLSAANDGSQKPVGILAVDIDASEEAVTAPVYYSGEFAASHLTFGTGHDAETVEEAFRAAAAPLFIRELG
jgi:hypothetical protein